MAKKRNDISLARGLFWVVFQVAILSGASAQTKERSYTVSPSGVEQGKEYELIIKSVNCTSNDLRGADLVAPVGSGIAVQNAVGINDCTMLARIAVAKDAPVEKVVLRVTKQDVVWGLVDLPVRQGITAASSSSAATNPSPTPAPTVSNAPLVIEGISWRGAVWILNEYQTQGAFSIDVRNAGDKTITTVHWDFYLMDSVRQRVYDHFKFVTDDKQIEPGKKIRLTKRFDYHTTPSYARGRAVIRKLIYSDGSTWNITDK